MPGILKIFKTGMLFQKNYWYAKFYTCGYVEDKIGTWIWVHACGQKTSRKSGVIKIYILLIR